MTTTTNTTAAEAFSTALSDWMSRDCPKKGRAAKWLGVSCRELDAMLAGKLPAKDRMISILARIAK